MVSQNVSNSSSGEELSLESNTKLCLCLIIPYCSLRHNCLTDTGAIALARGLQNNKSLEELK